MPVTERVRDPITAFLGRVKTGECGLVAVGVRREATGDYQVARALATSLLQDPPCEVVFLRVGV